MGLTAYAQEEKAKREAWYEMGKLRKRIAELENQWISVEDEMPSAKHAMVIVDFYGGNVGVGYPHKGKILDEPMGMLFNGVTHWQPMPAPKGQE